MPDRLVVGIISTCDPSRIEQAVAGLNRAQVRVLTSEQPTPAYENSPVTFIHVAEMMGQNSLADQMTRGTGVIPDSGGTAVPGINEEGGTLDAFEHPDVLDHLSGLQIPDGDTERYNDAIDDGRCVVVYTCDAAAADAAKTALAQTGATEVKVF